MMYIIVPSKSNKHKNLLASWRSLKKEEDPDLEPNREPLVTGTAPRIQIR